MHAGSESSWGRPYLPVNSHLIRERLTGPITAGSLTPLYGRIHSLTLKARVRRAGHSTLFGIAP